MYRLADAAMPGGGTQYGQKVNIDTPWRTVYQNANSSALPVGVMAYRYFVFLSNFSWLSQTVFVTRRSSNFSVRRYRLKVLPSGPVASYCLLAPLPLCRDEARQDLYLCSSRLRPGNLAFEGVHVQVVSEPWWWPAPSCPFVRRRVCRAPTFSTRLRFRHCGESSCPSRCLPKHCRILYPLGVVERGTKLLLGKPTPCPRKENHETTTTNLCAGP